MEKRKTWSEGDYQKMAENPNPPMETRKQLYALEYARKIKEMKANGKKAPDTAGDKQEHESDSEREQDGRTEQLDSNDDHVRL